MRPTVRLLANPGFPSFFKRSLDEFKRLSVMAIKLEALEDPKDTMTLWNFSNPDSVAACKDMCDQDIGGYSEAKLEFIPQGGNEPPHARFSGNISKKLPPLNESDIDRTGYAAWRTHDRPPTLFGKSLWDVQRYTYLALRVKTDRRKYKVNIQTESVVYTDIHQHRLYSRRPGEWETILIRWSDFVRTNHGLVVEPQSEMMTDKVRTIGIGLTDGISGPFEMCISRMWASNGLTQEQLEEAKFLEETVLPRKRQAALPSAQRGNTPSSQKADA